MREIRWAAIRGMIERSVRASHPKVRGTPSIRDGDLAILAPPEGRLGFTTGVSADLDQGHFPEDLLQSGCRPKDHGVKGHLYCACPAGGGDRTRNDNCQAPKLVHRDPRCVVSDRVGWDLASRPFCAQSPRRTVETRRKADRVTGFMILRKSLEPKGSLLWVRILR